MYVIDINSLTFVSWRSYLKTSMKLDGAMIVMLVCTCSQIDILARKKNIEILAICLISLQVKKTDETFQDL